MKLYSYRFSALYDERVEIYRQEKKKTESDSKDSNRDVCLAGLKPEDNTRTVEQEEAAIVSLMSIGKAKSYQMSDYHYSLNMDLLLGSEGQNVS